MSTLEVKSLRENVAELKGQVSETGRKLDRILFILNNDEGTGQDGLVAQVQEIKKKNHSDILRVEGKIDGFIIEYKKQEAVKNAKAGLIGAIAGGIVALLGVLSKFIHT
jgi:hypothetical protein